MKPKREVSGGKFPGRIRADLSAIASEFQDPGRSQIGLMHQRNLKGKSQEVNFLAAFDTDLAAIALEFRDPHQSQIGLIHRRNPKGKSQEVNFLAVFGTDLSAIASGF